MQRIILILSFLMLVLPACVSLHELARTGDIEGIKKTIADGVDINKKDGDGNTALMGAAEGNQTEVVKFLLENKANIKEKNKDQETSLMIATGKGHAEITKLLIDNKANVNDEKIGGETAFMVAAEAGHTAILKVLLDNGAKINKKNIYGWNALLKSIKNKHSSTTQFLIDNGADISVSDRRTGQTALMVAVENDSKAVQILLNNAVNIDVKDNFGQTAIDYAKTAISSEDEYPEEERLDRKKSLKSLEAVRKLRKNINEKIYIKEMGKGEVGDVWLDPITKMEFVWIPKDCYIMGSPENEYGRDTDEGPLHEVCVDGFWMGKTEVTNRQFRRFNPFHNSREYKAYGLNNNDQPAAFVNWFVAQSFAQWLTKKHKEKYKFRLPTEAEWEYACRGGNKRAKFWGNNPDRACLYANVADLTAKKEWPNKIIEHACDDSYAVSAPSGSFKQNAFGLNDILGNVWEWCEDTYSKTSYKDHETNNPIQSSSDNAYRVIRGGSWFDRPRDTRCANRKNYSAGGSFNPFLGFRLIVKP